MEGKQEADNGGHEDCGAVGVEFQDGLGPGCFSRSLALRVGEEEADDDHGDGADGQVDVEAPAPGDVVGEGAAEKRAGDGGDAVHGADEAGVDGSLFKRNGIGEDDQRAGEDTGRTDAGDGATDDQGGGGVGDAAD